MLRRLKQIGLFSCSAPLLLPLKRFSIKPTPNPYLPLSSVGPHQPNTNARRPPNPFSFLPNRPAPLPSPSSDNNEISPCSPTPPPLTNIIEHWPAMPPPRLAGTSSPPLLLPPLPRPPPYQPRTPDQRPSPLGTLPTSKEVVLACRGATTTHPLLPSPPPFLDLIPISPPASCPRLHRPPSPRARPSPHLPSSRRSLSSVTPLRPLLPPASLIPTSYDRGLRRSRPISNPPPHHTRPPPPSAPPHQPPLLRRIKIPTTLPHCTITQPAPRAPSVPHTCPPHSATYQLNLLPDTLSTLPPPVTGTFKIKILYLTLNNETNLRKRD